MGSSIIYISITALSLLCEIRGRGKRRQEKGKKGREKERREGARKREESNQQRV
jgi:hypothetical protein